MSERLGRDDELLMVELAELLGPLSEPPGEVLAAARELFTWRTVDAELAALTFDSMLDDGPALVRGDGRPRILFFETDKAGITVEVEVDESMRERRLVGQLVPGGPAALELRGTDRPVTGHADEMGRFVVPLPAGSWRVSLRCVLADGSAVETAWVQLS